MRDLMIVDGHNFLWRAYSVPFKFYSEKNVPLHVVSTYLKLIRRTVKSIDGDGMVVVFDTETTNDNFKASKDYKKNRKKFKKDEESPYTHLSYITKALDFLGVYYLEIPNIEADDIIATITKGFCEKDYRKRSYIFSSDTDFYQLLDEQTFIVKLSSGDDYKIIDSDYLRDQLGIKPNQYIEYKSLTGDSADNIKGIHGIGPVTARKILCEDMDCDIEKHTETLDLNRKLITLNCGCAQKWDFKDFSYDPNILNISNKEIFKSCGF